MRLRKIIFSCLIAFLALFGWGQLQQPKLMVSAHTYAQIPQTLYPDGLIGYTQGKRYFGVRKTPRPSQVHTRLSSVAIHQISSTELKAMNYYRANAEDAGYQAGPLRSNTILNRIATIRAREISHHFSHTQNGHYMVYQVAKNMNVGSNYNWRKRNLGENLILTGKLLHVQENTCDAYYYYRNPREIAWGNVFDQLYNDQRYQNKHGMNIMLPANHYVGIGTDYNRYNHHLYMAIIFSAHRPFINRPKKRHVRHRHVSQKKHSRKVFKKSTRIENIVLNKLN